MLMVLLDSPSAGGTKELLEREHIEYVWVVAEFPRVEAIIRLIPYYTNINPLLYRCLVDIVPG